MLHLALDRLDDLFDLLKADGRHLVGPTVRDGAVVLDRIRSSADLPRGVGCDQAPGAARLRDRGDEALFGFTVGPDSAKKWLYPARLELWRARRTEAGFAVEEPEAPPPVAILGLRACDLAAVAVQDRVLVQAEHADDAYAARRRDVLLIAVQCAESAATCFCTSMGTGPRVTRGYDLCLTEVTGSHFVVEVGSEAGQGLVDALDLGPAGDPEAPDAAAAAASDQQRVMPADVRERLLAALEGPQWDDVAARCLACTNCTLVCPTCFCTQVEDVTLLTGEAVHARRWDSCFSTDFSDLNGHPVRASVQARYRQWLTHKLATWYDQFGTSGCVGCGRCIAWCPAEIDIVAEALRIGGAP